MGVALLPLGHTAHALPPAGTDTLEVSGQVSVVSRLGQETISLSGMVTIQRSNPTLEAGVEVVDTEIISLSLTGQSLTGPITVSESATLTSSGEIRSLQPAPTQFPASSFFDVFIVVQAPASPSPTITLHNDTALHLVGPTLYEWPPPGVTYRAQPYPCVPLLPSLPKSVCVTKLSVVVGSQPDPSVGGIAELPEVAWAPVETPDSSGPSASVVAGIAGGVTAAIVALGGWAWRMRRLRRRR